MQREPAVRDCGGRRRAIFLVTATGTDELRVDDGDRQPPGVVGFDRIRRLKQFFSAASGDANDRSSLNFILAA